MKTEHAHPRLMPSASPVEIPHTNGDYYIAAHPDVVEISDRHQAHVLALDPRGAVNLMVMLHGWLTYFHPCPSCKSTGDFHGETGRGKCNDCNGNGFKLP